LSVVVGAFGSALAFQRWNIEGIWLAAVAALSLAFWAARIEQTGGDEA
jgi:hypothetical protein